MMDPLIYQLVVEQAKDYAVFVLDTEGRVQTWNVGARLLKGYEADEIIGQHFSIFYTQEALERHWPDQELRFAIMDGSFEDLGWRLRKDGSRFWASVTITALRDDNGKLLGFSKFTRDLTQNKMQEEALRQSEKRFRLLVDGVVDYAIFMLDPSGIVSSWNSGAQRIKGYTREEIIGKHFSHFYLEDDIKAGKPWEELATARRLGRAEAEGWRLKKNGERFWARAVVSALYDSEGHLLGFAKVTQDLTERLHIQDLEMAAKNMNEFIAILSHELRNPLAPISTAVEVMKNSSVSKEAYEAMCQTIDRQSALLTRIVDDMLDISRITGGLLRIENALVDIADVVNGAVDMVKPLIQTRKHTLEMDLPEKRLFVQGDIQRLTQVVANLLRNAAQYTPEGGRITIKGQSEDGQMVLRVIDTGQGISPQHIDRIFDMFVQGRTPIERVGSGLGVGLALARRLAKLHGGSLDVYSEGENKGSEFVLRMSFAAEPSKDANAGEVSDIVSQAVIPRRVLIVDDNADAATMLGMIVQTLGHEACVVHDGIEALKVAIDFNPEIVLLDIGMPGLDGYEVARRLRALALKNPFQIIAVTGWGQETDRRKSQKAGFDLHLVKPVALNDLKRILTESNDASLH